jgi:hypothetical protein
MNQGTLFAVRFDLDRLETIVKPVPALDGVSANIIGGVQLALSSDGTLIYVPGAVVARRVPSRWVTPDGRHRCSAPRRPTGANLACFSPDGQKLRWTFGWQAARHLGVEVGTGHD